MKEELAEGVAWNVYMGRSLLNVAKRAPRPPTIVQREPHLCIFTIMYEHHVKSELVILYIRIDGSTGSTVDPVRR